MNKKELSSRTIELHEIIKNIGLDRKWFDTLSIDIIGYQHYVDNRFKYDKPFVRIDIGGSKKYSRQHSMGTNINWLLDILRKEIVDPDQFKDVAIVFGKRDEALAGILKEYFL